MIYSHKNEISPSTMSIQFVLLIFLLLIWEKTLLYKRKLDSAPVSTMREFNQSINPKKIWAFVLLFFFSSHERKNYKRKLDSRRGFNQSINPNKILWAFVLLFFSSHERKNYRRKLDSPVSTDDENSINQSINPNKNLQLSVSLRKT